MTPLLRRLMMFFSLGTALLTAAPVAFAQWTGDFNVVLGAKRLDDDPWRPIDSQPSFGLMFDARQEDWPLNLALDLFYSGDEGKQDGVNREGSTLETNIGMRKIWRPNRAFRPFLGVGSSFIRASLKESPDGLASREDTDWGAGVWIGGGLYWTLADALNIGFDLKYSSAKVTLLDDRYEAGGRFFGTIIGLSW